ncbi:cardiolipin synthetase 2 [Desulfomicrobium apsheronum]|uniref:Cardiolipin synthetase 2 n=1 Tax=Desulfomicrobium apsheronum TaxID=52560 RepID=A0A1I3RHB0_9BACT|nr:phospholipase D-like domain-containing protein [Desulfomicrobium apsheronum]MDY0225851.1 phospholipase D-like domain-containing protein [Desulfomicrobium apsheronum]SFJ46004.1 cardiolipin synthetase 2 [Desulfomicrobium apsheronum]
MHVLNWLGLLLLAALALGAAGHALLRKSDSRSALGWVGVCLTFPLAGPILYILFGVNRVRRSASRMRKEVDALAANVPPAVPSYPSAAINPTVLHHAFQRLERVGHNILGTALVGGNCVEPLFNGDEAYPVMLRAMEDARHSIYLTTYILDTDNLGLKFIDALARAVHRGVDVRVLVDGVGEKYSWPRASRMLAKKDVPNALFIPPRLFPPDLHFNLRNHRKVLVVDGCLGFTGGMNISQKHVLGANPPWPVKDLHFIVHGPVANLLQDTFVDDWFFATKERIHPPVLFTEPTGDCLCRTVVDGPNFEEDHLKTLLTGIISAATTSIRIMTPYFLPPRTFLSALMSARYRGVTVEILLPGRNNIPFVHWACSHILDELLRAGISIAFQPAPFNHTKLMLVDGCYVHLGSANLDSRSLRLNFELTLEVLDQHLAIQLTRHFDTIMARSRPITRQELAGRSLPVRLRDAFFWLFSPYL